jgi:hypothetical protein
MRGCWHSSLVWTVKGTQRSCDCGYKTISLVTLLSYLITSVQSRDNVHSADMPRLF